MSASGQTRRFRDVRDMSGLPQTANISGPGRHFALGPIADLNGSRVGWVIARPVKPFYDPRWDARKFYLPVSNAA